MSKSKIPEVICPKRILVFKSRVTRDSISYCSSAVESIRPSLNMVLYHCPVCERGFTRHANMLRHIQALHPKTEEDTTEDEESVANDSVTDNGTENNEETDDDKDSEEEEEEEASDDDDDDTDDDSESEEVEEEEEIYDLWKYLKSIATKDEHLKNEFEEIKEKLADKESSDEVVSKMAWRIVKPHVCENIYSHYINFLKLWHFAKEDETHRQVMRTKRKLIEEEEDMEPVEAIEIAVKRRKYIIQKATGMLEDDPLEEILPPPSLTEEETDKEEGEREENPFQFKIPKPT